MRIVGITTTSITSSPCELTFADGGRGDPLGDDDENLLISHEPDSYTKSNQFL